MYYHFLWDTEEIVTLWPKRLLSLIREPNQSQNSGKGFYRLSLLSFLWFLGHTSAIGMLSTIH